MATDPLKIYLRERSPARLEWLVHATKKRLTAVAKRVIGDHHLAEDAVQDIFIDIWTHAGRFDPSKASETTFVATITRRRLIDRLRKQGRRDRFTLKFFTPAEKPGQRLGPKAVEGLMREMSKRGIETHLGHKIKSFENHVVTTEGGEIPADLIMFMPGLTGPAWISGSSLPLSPGGMIQAEAIGGMTLGADPIVCPVAALSHIDGPPLRAIIVRKASKEHGTSNRIECNLEPGSRVVVVDDVVTTTATAAVGRTTLGTETDAT